MTGLLRCIGLLNAALWFGAAGFYLLGVSPAMQSDGMKELLGRNFFFYGGAVEHVVATRWVHLQTVFALIAILHLLAEWLYLGRLPRRFWRAWLLVLCFLTLLGGYWMEPKLDRLHRARYAVQTAPAVRESARVSYPIWRTSFLLLEGLLAIGIGVYLWQMANPPEKTRFVSTGHFLG